MTTASKRLAAEAVLIDKQRMADGTPSRADGIDIETERSLRSYGSALVHQCAVLLNLKTVTAAGAAILVHRFYFRRSLREFDIRFVAAAAVYLAAKMQEDPRRVRDIILALTFLHWQESLQKDPDAEPPEPPPADSAEYVKTRNSIHRVERYILRETGFLASAAFVYPHQYILEFIRDMFSAVEGVDTRAVAQRAWGYITDSYRSTVCCEFVPHVVAAACVFLSAEDCGVPLPEELRWHELFGVSWQAVMEVADRLRLLYLEPPPKYVRLQKDQRAAAVSEGPAAAAADAAAVAPSSAAAVGGSTAEEAAAGSVGAAAGGEAEEQSKAADGIEKPDAAGDID